MTHKSNPDKLPEDPDVMTTCRVSGMSGMLLGGLPISLMTAINRSIMNCSELVFNITGLLFYMMRLKLASWDTVTTLSSSHKHLRLLLTVWSLLGVHKAMLHFSLFVNIECIDLFEQTLLEKSMDKTDQEIPYLGGQCEQIVAVQKDSLKRAVWISNVDV